MRPKNFSGEGTDADCGTYETNRETKCWSVVAAAIASTEPGSGTSGFCATALIANASANIDQAGRNMGPLCMRIAAKFNTHTIRVPVGTMMSLDNGVSEYKRAALAARLAGSDARQRWGYGTDAVETLTCGPTIAIAKPGAAFTFATSENVC